MRIKLLLLCFLLGTFYANAQINFYEDFESITMPSGWTTVSGNFSAGSSCEGTISLEFSSNGNLKSSDYTSSGGAIDIGFTYKGQSATIKFSLVFLT